MKYDKYGNPLLTPEASVEYWTQAVRLAKAMGVNEMTIDEFDEYLQLVDETQVQKSVNKHPAVLRPSHDEDEVAKAWEYIRQSSRYDGTITGSIKTKVSALRRLQPLFANMTTEEVVHHPDFWKYSTTGKLYVDPILAAASFRRGKERRGV
jgi:hypothetical protein